jgi:cbb3-type cytochrome oxidase maturation protein
MGFLLKETSYQYSSRSSNLGVMKGKEMDSWVIAMMLGASLFLGGVALVAFMWGIKNGQFDDETKMMNQVLYDDEAELNDAAEQQRKRENSLKKKEYKPE